MSLNRSLFSDKARCLNQSERALYGNFIIIKHNKRFCVVYNDEAEKRILWENWHTFRLQNWFKYKERFIVEKDKEIYFVFRWIPNIITRFGFAYFTDNNIFSENVILSFWEMSRNYSHASIASFRCMGSPICKFMDWLFRGNAPGIMIFPMHQKNFHWLMPW